jgi:predicted dienelactone hydrolase
MKERRILLVGACGLAILFLAGCGQAERTSTPIVPSETLVATVAPTGVPTAVIAADFIPPTETPEPPDWALAEPGPYIAGNTTFHYIDESRDGREISVTIWYPALEQKDEYGRQIARDAMPDRSAAPYPLILVEPNSGETLFRAHLVSHGFVMAIVRFPTEYENWDLGVVDHPRDMVFALEQIAANPPESLEGLINTDQVGVTGYSWGGFYALALSGVRIDPQYYLAACESAPGKDPPLEDWYLEYTCSLAKNWDEFAAHVGEEISTSEDGLWQPITDERIRAVLPMAPDGAWLYGERGLAAADKPVLLIAPAEDEWVPAMIETGFIFEHLNTPELALISFLGKQHMMVWDEEPAARMKHFAAAYFGYHLQGREDYKELYSEEFVSQFPDLAWGFFRGE